jgi:16S rRNA G966 N2-methylase RsmD
LKILFVEEALFDRDENWPHCAMLHADCRFGNGDIGIEIIHRQAERVIFVELVIEVRY